MRRSSTAAALVLVSVLAACGDDDAPANPDASSPDAGTTEDAGPMPPDAGPPGEALEPIDDCDDMLDALYETPDGLPPFAASERGSLLGCGLIETISAADVARRIGSSVTGGVTVGGGVRIYLIAYRTERDPGEGGISTGLVYLPDVTRSERVPIIMATHGTVGLGDECAPSHEVREDSTGYWDYLFLAWAARGLPVVASDYAGLGTEGVHAYGSWLDPARSAIDSARALRSMLPEDRIDGTTIVYGHSQGGGVALGVAASLTEAPDLDVTAVVAFAPNYRTSTSLVDALRLPAVRLTPGLRAAATLIVYSDFANLTDDPAHFADAFHPTIRDTVDELTSTLCYGPLITALDTPADGYVPAATIGDLADPAFVDAALLCADMDMCEGLAGDWVARDRANEPHLAPDGPPVLVIASSEDEQVSPGLIGCVLDRIEDDGVTPDICIHETGGHSPIVANTTTYAIEWALAASAGSARPACTGMGTRRACSVF